MSKLKDNMAKKKAEKVEKKKLRGGGVTSINKYQRQVPKNYRNHAGQLVISHEEIAGRCMTSADMLMKQRKGDFLRLWALPESLPLCYMLFAYHQNCMVVSDMTIADVIVEAYEQDEEVPIMGAKPDVQYVALFKDNEGEMPWTVSK